MPDTAVIAQFERRLVELGCPWRRLREKVRELAEHHQDLKQAALEEGLTDAEAEGRADAQLGDPMVLAENAVMLLRQSSWWGRHPIIGFCLLPPLGFIPAWAACWGMVLGACWLAGNIFGPAYAIDERLASAFSDDPALFNGYVTPANFGLTLAAVLLIVLVFCQLARRSAAGPKWMLTACGVCSLSSYFSFAAIEPHNVTVGYWFGLLWRYPQWIYAGVPLLAGVAIFLGQCRCERRLARIAMEQRPKGRRGAPNAAPPRQSLSGSPTYWVVAALTLILLKFVIAAMADSRIDKMREADLKAKVWPAERAAILALLKTRQSAKVPAGEQTIDLRPWQNATLLDSTDGAAGVKENNLAQLSAGVHTFGGVRFDVEGKIQLLGQPLPKSHSKFPGRIDGITIRRKCARLQLLQGASALHTPGKKIARLVLHYADGTKADIGIVGGEHVLDWWGPIYNTDAGTGRDTTSPDTELAWSGSNPRIKERAPDFSLRLYRSAFANPRPDLEIASVDYVSTLSGAAPFLVGLTTEQPPAP
jgi:hypothetical protein